LEVAAIKVIECRDVDNETAKKEVAEYFQMKARHTPLMPAPIYN
jgi:hypothetical protein